MLHGEIKVNDRVIGVWQARRTQRFPAKVNDYDCKVSWTDLAGNSYLAEFDLRHHFGHGALVLTAAILTEAHKRIHQQERRTVNG